MNAYYHCFSPLHSIYIYIYNYVKEKLQEENDLFYSVMHRESSGERNYEDRRFIQTGGGGGRDEEGSV